MPQVVSVGPRGRTVAPVASAGTPHLLEIEAPRRARQRGRLLLTIIRAPGSVDPGNLYSEIARIIAEAYFGQSGSITRGLRAGVIQVNDLLFQRNLRADTDHRLALGLQSVALVDEHAYAAQVGPVLLTHVRGGQARCWPERSVWTGNEPPGPLAMHRQPPAGLRREVEPELYHVALQEGDLLLASGASLARLAPLPELATALAGDPTGAAARLADLASTAELDALVLACPAPRVPERERAPASPAAAPEPAPPAEDGRLTPEPEPSAEEHEPVTPPEAEPPLEEPAPEPEGEERGPEPAVTPLMREAEVTPAPEEEAHWQAEDDFAEEAPSRPKLDLRGAGSRLGHTARRAQGGLRQLLLQLLPERVPDQPPPRPRPKAAPVSLHGGALVLTALAIPLVVLALVVTTRVQYDRQRRTQFTEVLAEAQARYDSAMQAPSTQATREELVEALYLVEEGLALAPDSEALVSLERRVRHRLDEINSVQRLYHFWQLAEVEAPAHTDSARLIVRGIDLYMVHRGGDRVFKWLLNQVGDALQPIDNPVLARKGEIRAGVTMGDMVDIAWLEAGGQRSLSTFVALERGGSLLAYDPQQGIDVLPVANSDAWLKPVAIGGYFGNLYVLDPLLSRILKYVPTDNAYTTPPTDYIPPEVPLDLTGAVDMAIDGNVYILFADGRIVKLFDGQPQEFSMSGLPDAMRSPNGIVVSGEPKPDAEGYVYVADAGNARIVQFTKDGRYVRQLRARPGDPQLEDLRGLYVDEAGRRLFVLSGQALWLTDLPALNVLGEGS